MRFVLPLTVALIASVACGCVERKLFIRTDPEGAVVTLNREPIEYLSPAEVEFDHYGTFDVRAEKEGYLPLRENVPVATPWYAYPVIDFLSEILWPFTIEDHRYIDLELTALPAEPDYDKPGDFERAREEARQKYEELRRRAEEMRKAVNEGDPAEVR